jgi:hypothetical protein
MSPQSLPLPTRAGYQTEKQSAAKAATNEYNRFLGSATAAHEDGYAEFLTNLMKMQRESVDAAPKLELPGGLASSPKDA